MRLEFFHLKKHPFSLFPDPRVVFFSQSHARVKSSLSYAAWKGDGTTLVTGANGSGKTLLLKYHQQRMRSQFDCIYLLHTRLDATEFLRSLLAALGKAAFTAEAAKLYALIHREMLNRFAKGRRCLLLIDDAHDLSVDALLTLNSLSQLGVGGKPLLTLVLAGNPSLLSLLDRPELASMCDQVRFRCELEPLPRLNTAEYISFRLLDAGAKDQVFSGAAKSLIHQFTGGMPRQINLLAEMALVAAFVKGDRQVSAVHVGTAIEELDWQARSSARVLGDGASTEIAAEMNADSADSDDTWLPRVSLYRNGALLDVFVLDLDELTLGRGDANTIRLYDSLACENHAVIRRQGSGFMIEHVGKVGTTVVNSQPVLRSPLKMGDEVQIASYTMSFDTNRPKKERSDNLQQPNKSSRSHIITQVSWLDKS